MSDAIPRGERQYSGIVDACRKLYAEGGIPRFYRGLVPCLCRAVLGNAIMLPVVDVVRTALG